MAKYRVVSPYVDSGRNRRKKGEIVEISKARGDRLVARRLVVPADRQSEVETATRTPTETADAVVHVGGGYYQLPNGERVKGKAEVEKRMKQE